MKNKSYILIIFFISLFSCDKYLDIEPEQAISTSVALSTEQGIRTAVIGAYELLSFADLFSGDVILNSALYANNKQLFWTGPTIDLNQYLDKNLSPDNFSVETFWINSYGTINQVNNIINALDVVDVDNPQSVEAEARFIRGLIYFDLINMYAKTWVNGDPQENHGVPIVEIPTEQTTENTNLPRNSVADVYAFILEDMLFAKTHLPEQNDVFANTFAASALLSRIYLMQENFSQSEKEANRVIESGYYELLPEVAFAYNPIDNTSEDIFAIQVTPQAGFNRVSYFHTGEFEGGGGFVGVTDDHMNSYEPGDERTQLFYFDGLNNIRRTSKWKLRTTNDGNVQIIRLAEIYLNRAECRYRLGEVDGAMADINIIRNRAELVSLEISELTLESIINERFVELVFEGHLYRDSKRLKIPFGDIPFDDPRMIYPIPQRELLVNPALIQNEGY